MQGLIGAAFLAFILLTSNPFERLSPAPFEGRDLNPILQDPGLAIHPPLLYLGYVGFSIVFSFAAAALIEGRIDAAWARFVRPFALVAWCFLTLGIAMGSYWAYYTLGWGGFWFWDPVENASLMPWLAGTAFLHSVAVMEKRDALKVWTIFLAILAFSLLAARHLPGALGRADLGARLRQRSAPRRVHPRHSRRCSSPARWPCSPGARRCCRQGGLFAPISREGALVVNNLLLTTVCATVFFGTLYPLALEQFTGEKITVGAPFFNLTCGRAVAARSPSPTPFGFSLAWKRGDLLGVAQRLAFAFAGGLVVFVALVAVIRGGPVLAPLAAALGRLRHARRAVRNCFARAWRPRRVARRHAFRARGLPLSFWGGALAHFGVGVTLLGLAATGFGAETIVAMKPGATVRRSAPIRSGSIRVCRPRRPRTTRRPSRR